MLLLVSFLTVVFIAIGAGAAPIGPNANDNNKAPMLTVFLSKNHNATIPHLLVKKGDGDVQLQRRHVRSVAAEESNEQMDKIIDYSIKAGKCLAIAGLIVDLMEKEKNLENNGFKEEAIRIRVLYGSLSTNGGRIIGNGLFSMFLDKCIEVEKITQQWKEAKAAAGVYNQKMQSVFERYDAESDAITKRMIIVLGMNEAQVKAAEQLGKMVLNAAVAEREGKNGEMMMGRQM